MSLRFFHSEQLHFLGEILGGEGFASGIWCKFVVESGKHWTLLSGATTGQTHIGYDVSLNSNSLSIRVNRVGEVDHGTK